MSSTRSRPKSQPHDPAERRLRVAMRMSQLASSRALIFIIGLFCVSFGIISLVLERNSTNHIDTNIFTAKTAPSPSAEPSAITVGQAESKDEQLLYVIITAFGIICFGLAKYLYHGPLMIPIFATICFAPTFLAFLKLNHTDSPTAYTVASFCILGILILSLRAGHLFRLSYARMGRPTDH